MDTQETILAKWNVSKDQVIFPAVLVSLIIFFLFGLTSWGIYFVSQSTNVLILIIPIILFFILLAALPEFFKSLKSAPENSEVYLTDKGVYRRDDSQKDQKFIPWEQMSSYDMSYLGSTTPLGKLFIRPTKFFLKSKYEEDNFIVETFGENVDILRAYLKENNVPFGFLKNS